MVHTVISDIPGVRLDKTMYQGMPLTERQEICEAFKETWLYVIMSCFLRVLSVFAHGYV